MSTYFSFAFDFGVNYMTFLKANPVSDTTGCPKKIVPRCCCCCGGVVDSTIWVLHSCIGQVSTWSLGPFMSQSDTWLLIYGREKAK